MMGKRIDGARLIVIPGCGHRVIWEATDECVSIVSRFLLGENESPRRPHADFDTDAAPPLLEAFWPALEMFTYWPLLATSAAIDLFMIARQSMLANGSARFGDGKPIVLFPQDLAGRLNASVLSDWLKAFGYRPVTANLSSERALIQLIGDVTQRLERKAVLVTGFSGFPLALEGAKAHPARVSDLVVLGAPIGTETANGIRSHFISFGWPLALTILPPLLRELPIELLEAPVSDGVGRGTSIGAVT